MFVTLRYKTKDGQNYKTKNRLTVKEAKKMYEEKLLNDSNVVKVCLTHFDGWHERLYRTLKEIK